MIHAYHENYLEQAQESFGCMLDYAVHDMKVSLEEYYSWFLYSDYARLFGRGDCSIVAGRSGPEIAMDVYYACHREFVDAKVRYTYRGIDRSPEYWTGWALAYYQWESNSSFKMIEGRVPIREIYEMYPAYHEMDIRQFVDQMDLRMSRCREEVRLKQLRRLAGYSQRQLAELSEVPLRTIQQYEQRQKDIKKAQAQSVLRLASALGCEVEDILD